MPFEYSFLIFAYYTSFGCYFIDIIRGLCSLKHFLEVWLQNKDMPLRFKALYCSISSVLSAIYVLLFPPPKGRQGLNNTHARSFPGRLVESEQARAEPAKSKREV